MQLAMSKIKDKQQKLGECVTFNNLPKIYNNCQGTHH